MSEDRTREYAEWYVWAKRNVTSTPEICHAAAQAATEAKRAGGDPLAAARNAATSRSGHGWAHPEEPAVRQFAEWYDWARIELGASGDDLVRATTAAVDALKVGGDAGAASAAARAALGGSAPAPAEPSAMTSSALPPPIGSPMQPLPPPPAGSAPPPPPPPSPGWAPGSPPAWSPASYPAVGPAATYGYPGSAGTDGFAVASLICAIVALPAIVCYGVPGIILGLVGFFLGRSGLKRIAASGGYKGGRGVATAGWIVGIIAAALGLLYAVVAVGAVALYLSGVIPSSSPSP
jgi:hypothetical protein